MSRTLLVVLLFLPAGLQAQDDPLETHLYNVEFLTSGIPDHPGESMGLAMESLGTAVAEGENWRSPLSGEDLLKLIRANVAEDTWEHVASHLAFGAGVLTVTNRKSVHEKIGQYLAWWRGYFGRLVCLDALIVSADPALTARLRAAGDPDRPSILAPDALRQLLEAAREGKQAELLRSMRITAQPGQRVSFQELTKQSYVRDYDVQIAASAGEFDPIVDVLATGPSIDVRVHLEPFAGGVTLETRLDSVDPEAMGERKLRLSKEMMTMSPLPMEPGKPPDLVKGPVVIVPVERKVQLPVVQHDKVRTMLTIRDRESAVVASLFRKNRQVLYILTPGIVSTEEKPVPEPAFAEQRLMRVFDVSPLTRGVQDWSGPELDLVSPSRGGGGPLTGATYTLDEPAVLMGPEDVSTLIQSRVAADTWGNKRNSIEHSGSGRLLICQKADVLREIDKLLSTLITARAQMITTEALVIGFKKGSRAEWEKEISALAPGGYFAESAKMDRLLEEAGKGQGVRLIDAAEITGFPQQRVLSLRCREEAYLQDYEPQVSSYVSAMDPIIGVFMTGFMMNVRPSFIHGTDRIAVDFRAALCTGETGEVDALGGAAGALQTARIKSLKWNATVTCAKGKYSLVAMARLGSGEEAEEVALFVRARPNLLK